MHLPTFWPCVAWNNFCIRLCFLKVICPVFLSKTASYKKKKTNKQPLRVAFKFVWNCFIRSSSFEISSIYIPPSLPCKRVQQIRHPKNKQVSKLDNLKAKDNTILIPQANCYQIVIITDNPKICFCRFQHMCTYLHCTVLHPSPELLELKNI